MKEQGCDDCQGDATKCELALRQEEAIQTFVDEAGVRWHKVYFGSGSHFQNWLDQCTEIFGSDNILVEDIPSTDFACFDSEMHLYRIWVKKVKISEESPTGVQNKWSIS